MDSQLANLALIVTRAPWWVWPLFALLVIGGVARLKARSLPLARVTIVPVVFLAWGLISLGGRLADRPLLALPWLAAALLGSTVGWFTSPTGVRADRAQRRIYIPGSPATLFASLTVFVLKYACSVAAAIRPEDRALIAVIDMAISGASAGYFWSGLVRILLRYRAALSDSADAGQPIPGEAGTSPLSA